jgi:hypothetical protein
LINYERDKKSNHRIGINLVAGGFRMDPVISDEAIEVRPMVCA